MGKYQEFRPIKRTRQLLISLTLCYGILFYLLFTLPSASTLSISCALLAMFVTLVLTMYHRSLSERRLSVGDFGVKIHRGKRFIHVPWPQIVGVKEVWVGHMRQRHRRFYLATDRGELIELMREGEYRDLDAAVALIASYRRETARP